MDTNKRFELMEKRLDKVEDKVNLVLQEIAGFKPILETMNENIQKISETSVDKERMIALEKKVNGLEKELDKETIEKKAELLEEIMKYVILAIVGIAIGYFFKGWQLFTIMLKYSHVFSKGVFFLKLMQYTYVYEPELYNYILASNILNKSKKEDKIIKKLVNGYTCKEIGESLGYSERTIQNRRKDIYEKTKKYMV